jgi:hypothetical protein
LGLEATNKRTTKTALLVAGAASQKADSYAPPPPAPDRANTNNFYGSQSHGRGRGGGCGHGAATVGAVVAGQQQQQ